MRKSEFEKKYFTRLIHNYIRWEADEKDIQCFLEDIEYMNVFNILFANDTCVILDAGCYKLYIEWGINECPVYVDIDGKYTYIGSVRNSRFWALADRKKRQKMGRKTFKR